LAGDFYGRIRVEPVPVADRVYSSSAGFDFAGDAVVLPLRDDAALHQIV
jgi:hypothetical protein